MMRKVTHIEGLRKGQSSPEIVSVDCCVTVENLVPGADIINCKGVRFEVMRLLDPVDFIMATYQQDRPADIEDALCDVLNTGAIDQQRFLDGLGQANALAR